MLKTCSQCKKTKPLSEYSKRTRSKDGLMAACRACYRLRRERDREQIQKRGQRYYIENQERIRAFQRKNHRSTHLMARYGITIDEWEAIFESQGRVCAICKTDTPINRWHTDHCHNTRKVRGVLCQRCNIALGHFDDDQERLLAAHQYLSHRPPKNPQPAPTPKLRS